MSCYAASFGIAMCYLTLTVANESFSTCRIYAKLSTDFAVVYCTMVCIVYYTQLTYVRLGSPSDEALSLVSYQHTGSAFFAIDLCGYFFMSVSVSCLGLSMDAGLLRKLLVAMGLWGATCIAVPFFPFFYNQDDPSSSSDQFGVVALSLWAILFLPLMVLLAQHYLHLAGRTSSSKND